MNINFYILQNIEELKSLSLDFINQKERFENLFVKVNFPVTLVVENFYSDRDYKDSYYHFFASKYIDYSKYSHRIAVFEGEISKAQFYSVDFSLQEKLIGVTTIKPLKMGSIGKTFFNPSKLNIKKSFIRTTKFEIGILGRRLAIESFPFSSQDGEYMTCAETTLWSMLQYYGTRYKEYKVALPHEIVNIIDDKHFQRVSPSSGLHYMQSSEVFKKFGFSSQVYYRFVGTKNYYSPDNQFKRLFHYYVESGIPLMTGIRLKSTINNSENGHAVVCIGHGEVNNTKQSDAESINEFKILNSADFVDEYVYMDDNKYPFYTNQFDEFEYNQSETKIKYFIVPLYKRVFLDAFEAEKTFYEVLKNEVFGLKNLKDASEPLVIRIFLTTAKNYKESRFRSLAKSYILLDNMPLPKFIWVCEISTQGLYAKGKIFGEIVLDATASKNDKFNQLILLRYPQKLSFKLFDESLDKLKLRLTNRAGLENVYDMYKNNLKEK